MAVNVKPSRVARLIGDARPVLKKNVLVIPPSRRENRLLGPAMPTVVLELRAERSGKIPDHPSRRGSIRAAGN
jgi:hypothetical protein